MSTQHPKATVGERIRDSEKLAWIVTSPKVVWNTLIIAALAGVLGLTLYFARESPKVAVGTIMSQTRAARVAFKVVDPIGTESDRELARSRAPSVYVGEAKFFEELRASIENVPSALANAATLEDVDQTIRQQYALSEQSLQAIRRQADPATGAPVPAWKQKVARLDALIRRAPLVDEKTSQREKTSPNKEVELRIGLGPAQNTTRVATGEVISVTSPKIEETLRQRAMLAGFGGELLDALTARLAHNLRPTFIFDEALTKELAEQAAAMTPPREVQVARGQLLYAPGEELTADKHAILGAEVRAWRKQGDPRTLWAATIALYGAGLLAALGLGAYVATYAPAIWRVPRRLLAVAVLASGAIALSCWIAAVEPRLVSFALTAPVLFITVIIAVAFDRRTALAAGSLLGILAVVALEQPVVMIGLPLVGVWLTVWRLNEFRHRDALVKAGFLTGLALLLTTVLLEGLNLPLSGRGFTQALASAGFAGGGGLLVGFVVLGLMPFVERAFGVTTGMTLIELRDPKQPLLRELQQRAPGTYNHSLNVAALAEVAADAIGADALLTYVGALYHDVGKMTKPEYFVENQVGGLNRHDKLPPAMSLLIITGHVKEGVELAKEHALPKPLWHFIESHHGTTLVEYFFHRARKAAEAPTTGPRPEPPAEIEYRYAGPRPRTREAAILMICDAAESATRSLPDPSPTRIESLVRAIAHKRLMDGQFDNCDLTLRDVAAVVDAVSRALAAIHHQRVAYPDSPSSLPIRQPAPPLTQTGLPPAPATAVITTPATAAAEKRA